LDNLDSHQSTPVYHSSIIMLMPSRRLFSFVVATAAKTLPKNQVAAFASLAPATTTILGSSATRPSSSKSTRRTFFSSAPLFMFAPHEVVRGALANPKTTVLDVRRIDEILESGFLKTDRQWVHAQCTLTECPLLDVAAESLIPDKHAPVVVYCASGKRAAKAKEVLESKGYVNVLNAGGLGGLGYLKASEIGAM
jgi:phage shock protein E